MFVIFSILRINKGLSHMQQPLIYIPKQPLGLLNSRRPSGCW